MSNDIVVTCKYETYRDPSVKETTITKKNIMNMSGDFFDAIQKKGPLYIHNMTVTSELHGFQEQRYTALSNETGQHQAYDQLIAKLTQAGKNLNYSMIEYLAIELNPNTPADAAAVKKSILALLSTLRIYVRKTNINDLWENEETQAMQEESADVIAELFLARNKNTRSVVRPNIISVIKPNEMVDYYGKLAVNPMYGNSLDGTIPAMIYDDGSFHKAVVYGFTQNPDGTRKYVYAIDTGEEDWLRYKRLAPTSFFTQMTEQDYNRTEKALTGTLSPSYITGSYSRVVYYPNASSGCVLL